MKGVLTTVAAALALLVTAAGASGNASHGLRPLGLVPHVRGPVNAHALRAAGPAPSFLTFDSPYESLINRYFADVAAASGSTSNVYSVATQYYGPTVADPIHYTSTFVGSYVDHDPLPANGCSDGVDPACLTDSQLQTEIQNVLTAKGWHGSLTNAFFLMTPVGVGSCGDASGSECSTNVFCAYHNAFTDLANEPVIYADEPYEATVGGCSGPGQGFPNDEDADTTINTISHEHNESITDPFGTGWVAADGQTENGDLCAYGYGSPLGLASNGQAYNQLINGHDYSLQQEYSNAVDGCQLRTGGPHTPPTSGSGPLLYGNGPVMHTNTTYAIYWLPTAGNTTLPAVSGTPLVNETLTSSTGSWSGAPTGYAFQWQRCSSSGTGCTNIPAATSSTYTMTATDVGKSVRSTISATNVNGASPYAASSPDLVVAVPRPTSVPRILGKAAVGHRLSAAHGKWSSKPAQYSYQWLRCSAGGRRCVTIKKATRATYRVAKKDAGHRLRLRVTATNAAGARSANSRPTTRVH